MIRPTVHLQGNPLHFTSKTSKKLYNKVTSKTFRLARSTVKYKRILRPEKSYSKILLITLPKSEVRRKHSSCKWSTGWIVCNFSGFCWPWRWGHHFWAFLCMLQQVNWNVRRQICGCSSISQIPAIKIITKKPNQKRT